MIIKKNMVKIEKFYVPECEYVYGVFYKGLLIKNGKKYVAIGHNKKTVLKALLTKH